MLVDHADAAGDGVGRPGELDLLAVEQDLALVRPGEPVEDVHQRGLAGAVLAEQRVDLAGPDLEVDVVVGDHARVPLRDATHLERGCLDLRDLQGSVTTGPSGTSGTFGTSDVIAASSNGDERWIWRAGRP